MCFNPKPAFISDIFTDKKPYVNRQFIDKNNNKLRKIIPNPRYGKLKRKIKFLNAAELAAYKENPSFYSNQKNFIMIPCGKCLSCRISKASDWAVRSIIESRQWKDNCFITLSYKPEKLPKNGSLCIRDIQLFMKRLRKAHPERKLRYFLTGEYGSKTLRAHYHMALFNYKPTDLKFFKFNKCKQPLYLSKEIANIWDNGFIIIGDLTIESAGYIARYTQKKIYNNHDKIAEALGRHKEFLLTSRRPGIGLHILHDQKEFEKMKNNFGILVKQNDKVLLKNIPQTIRNKWKEIDDLEYFTLAEQNRQEVKNHWQEVIKKAGINEIEYQKNKNKIELDRLMKLKREAF